MFDGEWLNIQLFGGGGSKSGLGGGGGGEKSIPQKYYFVMFDNRGIQHRWSTTARSKEEAEKKADRYRLEERYKKRTKAYTQEDRKSVV